MDIRKITSIVIAIIIIIIAIYDVYAIMKGGTEASISMVMIGWSYKYPAFTFLMGFTMGHLFWRVRDNKYTKELGKDEQS